jgi:hypothetical protein
MKYISRCLWVGLCLISSVARSEDAKSPGPVCTAPVLSDQQVKDIVAKERATREDLPVAFSQSRIAVSRQGCHYLYMESSVPPIPDVGHIFKLNKKGIIVYVQSGNGLPEGVNLTCPVAKPLSDSRLAEIIKNERAKRSDLPPAFTHSTVRVAKLQCTYMYFEYPEPKEKNTWQEITVDPFGEVMDFMRNKP